MRVFDISQVILASKTELELALVMADPRGDKRFLTLTVGADIVPPPKGSVDHTDGEDNGAGDEAVAVSRGVPCWRWVSYVPTMSNNSRRKICEPTVLPTQ